MNIKMLPTNIKGTVSIGAVASVALTIANRAALPMPPGNVAVNGQVWPNGTHLTAGTATLTWAHRVRTMGTTVVHQDAASQPGGPEGTYTVEVLKDGTVVRTVTNLTGTSFAYDVTMQTTDGVTAANVMRFRITPVNGTLTGTVRTTDPFYIG